MEDTHSQERKIFKCLGSRLHGYDNREKLQPLEIILNKRKSFPKKSSGCKYNLR
jgi:hypothetical protein